MSQRKLLNDKQLGSLKQMGFTKKELESLATIKCRYFFVNDVNNPGNLLRIKEDGSIKNG